MYLILNILLSAAVLYEQGAFLNTPRFDFY